MMPESECTLSVSRSSDPPFFPDLLGQSVLAFFDSSGTASENLGTFR
jgi:hypothetical protein